MFWSERQKVLSQAHQMQVFLEMTEQAKSWLASKEAFLNNDDVGVGSSHFLYLYIGVDLILVGL